MISLLHGAIAGFVETSVCHPLDTIKTRIQARTTIKAQNISVRETCFKIYHKEGIKGFYHGLTAVYCGVIPKNAVRFSSFETYKGLNLSNISAGMLAGATEALLVVNPTDVLKIRIQAQFHSMKEVHDAAGQNRQQHHVWALCKEIWRKEGWRGFYRGAPFTVVRQSINQGSNFTIYHWIRDTTDCQPFWAGCASGGVGPILNNPIDVIKTRLQTSSKGIVEITREIYTILGWRGFYKGLGPRLLRIVPGQGITFMVYGWLQGQKK